MSEKLVKNFTAVATTAITANEIFSKLVNEVGDMPNIEMPTMGGKIFWNTLIEVNNFKLQQNKFTDHVRILAADDTRLAWGSEEEMLKKLEKLTKK